MTALQRAPSPLGGDPMAGMDRLAPKVQICFDFTKGHCTRGTSCKYSHDLVHIVSVNSQERGICFDFLRGQCNRGLLCRFSHDISNIEQQAGPASKKNAPICYDFVKGLCSRGIDCRYSHDLNSVINGTRPSSGTVSGEICYDFTRGRCTRGSACRYSHDYSLLAQHPALLAGLLPGCMQPNLLANPLAVASYNGAMAAALAAGRGGSPADLSVQEHLLLAASAANNGYPAGLPFGLGMGYMDFLAQGGGPSPEALQAAQHAAMAAQLDAATQQQAQQQAAAHQHLLAQQQAALASYRRHADMQNGASAAALDKAQQQQQPQYNAMLAELAAANLGPVMTSAAAMPSNGYNGQYGSKAELGGYGDYLNNHTAAQHPHPASRASSLSASPDLNSTPTAASGKANGVFQHEEARHRQQAALAAALAQKSGGSLDSFHGAADAQQDTIRAVWDQGSFLTAQAAPGFSQAGSHASSASDAPHRPLLRGASSVTIERTNSGIPLADTLASSAATVMTPSSHDDSAPIQRTTSAVPIPDRAEAGAALQRSRSAAPLEQQPNALIALQHCGSGDSTALPPPSLLSNSPMYSEGYMAMGRSVDSAEPCAEPPMLRHLKQIWGR